MLVKTCVNIEIIFYIKFILFKANLLSKDIKSYMTQKYVYIIILIKFTLFFHKQTQPFFSALAHSDVQYSLDSIL